VRDRKSVESLREHSKSLIQGDEEYQRAQQEIAHLESKISDRMSMSKDLTRRSKRSLDDEQMVADLDRRAYDNDFVKNSETANKISSVLSAMVTHIEHVNRDAHETSQMVPPSPH
jgi:Skp family chaperone for outer membrane proteins